MIVMENENYNTGGTGAALFGGGGGAKAGQAANQVTDRSENSPDRPS